MQEEISQRQRGGEGQSRCRQRIVSCNLHTAAGVAAVAARSPQLPSSRLCCGASPRWLSGSRPASQNSRRPMRASCWRRQARALNEELRLQPLVTRGPSGTRQAPERNAKENGLQVVGH